MDKVEARKYAIGMNKIQLGTWGFDKKYFWTIHLTTKEGDDNSTERFGQDFRKLIKWIRKKGYKVEYCFAMGLTPGQSLLHGHGLLRINKKYFQLYDGCVKGMLEWRSGVKTHSEHLDANRRALGDKWNDIHGAFAVDIDRVRSGLAFARYISRHIMKDYIESLMIRNSFLSSFGWKRKGYENIVKEVKEWWMNGCDIWLGGDGWRIINACVQAFCESGSLVVNKDFGQAVMIAGKMKRLVVYAFDEKGNKIGEV